MTAVNSVQWNVLQSSPERTLETIDTILSDQSLKGVLVVLNTAVKKKETQRSKCEGLVGDGLP
jgi:hypothetical protein